ncbi:MAG: hypothetical protein K8I82_10235 [Anaerolineae bacterium]|nr:hypothetical protein [Anaerolineae bacterium]
MTGKHAKILEFIKGFMQEHGYAPTLREIMAGTAISSISIVSYHLNKMAKAGVIERSRGVSRGLRLPEPKNVEQTPIYIEVPVLKQPVTHFSGSIPHNDRVQDVPSKWLADKPLTEVYALVVNTHLMYDAMVGTGDVVILQRQAEVCSGDTAVIILKSRDEMRIRKVRYEGDWVALEPLLSVMQPLRVKRDEMQVVGKVLGLLREF